MHPLSSTQHVFSGKAPGIRGLSLLLWSPESFLNASSCETEESCPIQIRNLDLCSNSVLPVTAVTIMTVCYTAKLCEPLSRTSIKSGISYPELDPQRSKGRSRGWRVDFGARQMWCWKSHLTSFGSSFIFCKW